VTAAVDGAVGHRSGILLVDKPQSITSHDVVARTRRLAATRKVGHAGTLDPMATGLLVLGLNSATRLLTYLVGLDKEYFATIRLGAATNTDDAEGTEVSRASGDAVAAITAENLAEAIRPLTGEISQVPSSVSAIKVDGKRAYTLARAGESVELAARAVTVSTFEVLGSRRDADFYDVDVRVECSSGTYIRALARDLGATLNVGGHLTALRRTRIGPFSVADAAQLETMNVASALLDPALAAATLFPCYSLSAQEAIDLGHGKRLPIATPELAACDGPIAAIEPGGRLAGLISVSAGVAKPLVNFPKDEGAE
jgi:tRNA pseudouridine55 synthase